MPHPLLKRGLTGNVACVGWTTSGVAFAGDVYGKWVVADSIFSQKRLVELESWMAMQIDREIVGKFIDASVNDHVEAKRLLDAHPELRKANWLGDEHLMNFLVIENLIKGVQFCLENGFDANQPDGECGETPLHSACSMYYPEVAALLLKFGADPNAMSEIEGTPLHCCIRPWNLETAALLLKSGADPNATSETEDPPLHCCIDAGNVDMIDLLLTHGADPYYETILGDTVFDNWPSNEEDQSRFAEIFRKHNITKKTTESNDAHDLE